jgi:hypothetical protein
VRVTSTTANARWRRKSSSARARHMLRRCMARPA